MRKMAIYAGVITVLLAANTVYLKAKFMRTLAKVFL